jgi:hypothetical protein
VDGGVLAGRFLERRRLRLKRLGLFPEEKRLRKRLRRSTF